MKAFLAGCLGAIAIAVGAHFALDSLGRSSENVFSGDNVRLSDPATPAE